MAQRMTGRPGPTATDIRRRKQAERLKGQHQQANLVLAFTKNAIQS